MVVETQPESLATPPAELSPLKSPKGYVVLTIGLPGSGKTTWYKRRGVTPLSSDLLRTLLFGVSAYDPLIYAGVAFVVLGVGLVANFVPARRAARVDPMRALHFE